MKFDKDSKFQKLYIPLLLFAIAFVWKLFYLNARDLCLDEPYSVFFAQKSLIDIWKVSAGGEPNPPLFMFLLHFWIKIVGLDAGLIRLLPLFFNGVTVVFIYLTGKRFFSLWTGLVGAGFFIFSTYHFYHGLEARTYSLLVMATAAALYYFLHYAENTKNYKALTGLIISNTIIIYSHYFGLFVIFVQFITCFFYIRNFKSLLRFTYPFVGTAATFSLMIPILIKQYAKSNRIGTWLEAPSARDYMQQMYYLVNHRDVFQVLIYIFAAGIIFSAVMIYLKKWNGFNINLPVLFIWWFVPYSIMFLVSNKVPMFNSKYIIYNSIGMYLFIGAMINVLFRHIKFIEPIIGIAVVIVMGMYLKILPHYFAYREVKNSVEFARANKTERTVFLIYPVWADFSFNFYYDQNIFRDTDHYYETMNKNNVFRVWGLDNARSVLKMRPFHRIIYFQDGKIKKGEPDIFTYLDSAYVKVAENSFPQTFKIGVYDPKPNK